MSLEAPTPFFLLRSASRHHGHCAIIVQSEYTWPNDVGSFDKHRRILDVELVDALRHPWGEACVMGFLYGNVKPHFAEELFIAASHQNNIFGCATGKAVEMHIHGRENLQSMCPMQPKVLLDVASNCVSGFPWLHQLQPLLY